MQMLTKKIANEIVRETSLRLHRNVNIMNTEGIILSAMDKARIGAIHEGALKVLETKKMLVIHEGEELKGAQPGINLPIVFQDHIIGVIGITGVPAELEEIGELVKMTTELMIKQAFMDSQMEWQQRTKETVVDQLLKRSPSFTSVQENLGLLGFTLTPPFTSVIVQIAERSAANRTIIQAIEGMLGQQRALVSFINVNRLFIGLNGIEGNEADEAIQALQELLKKLDVRFRMAYSLPFHHLHQFNQSYKDCEIALAISGKDKECVSFSHIEVKSLFYQVDADIADRFAHRVLKNFDEAKAETLAAFFANNLNIQQTADALYLHRNTLIYRLKKIVEDTGHDPKNFEDALILQVALWIFQKEQRVRNP